MGKSYTKNYEINYYDVDCNLKCKIASIVNFICDVGTQQSESLGGGFEYCNEHKCAWVFYKDDIKMIRYPSFGEKISITTEAIGFKKFYGLRKYTIKDESSTTIGEGYALFFLINIEKRKPMRIQEEQYDFYGVNGDTDNDISMEKLQKLEFVEHQKEFNIRYSDIDSNKHVNNVKYIEWALEAVPIDIVSGFSLKRLKVVFEKEVKYGGKILSCAQVIDVDSTTKKTIHSIRNEVGKEVTELECIWEKDN